MTLKDLYALITAEYGGQDPLYLVSYVRWVMDLDSYKEVRAACVAAGAIYSPGADDPETWVPKPEDRLFALTIEVRDGGGPPHLERW